LNFGSFQLLEFQTAQLIQVEFDLLADIPLKSLNRTDDGRIAEEDIIPQIFRPDEAETLVMDQLDNFAYTHTGMIRTMSVIAADLPWICGGHLAGRTG
jgi:hypothetical protein